MELTVAKKLEALLDLQKIDSQIDAILKIRGDLPEEVRDLEDEIIGYETRISKFDSEIATLDEEIARLKNQIKEADKLIKKYQDQQMNVRNNREFEALSKEIESNELDKQLFEKQIKEANFRIEKKREEIAAIEEILVERRKDLESKKTELDVIIAESQDDEKQLKAQREVAVKKIEDRLIYSYDRIRRNSVNGLAVVYVKRGACGGCFNTVPPQRQADIKEKKKIIVCEHCGRVLADVEQLEPELVGSKK
jgi:predicted  nucleic acid-binding Zn-ribbon protein